MSESEKERPKDGQSLGLLLVHEDNGCAVWMTLEGHDPLNDPFGFVIGYGPTRPQAISDATYRLRSAINCLDLALLDESVIPIRELP